MMCGGELLQVGTFIGIVTFFIWRGGAIHQGDNKGGSEMLWSRVKNVSAPGCCWGRFLIRSLPVDRRRLRSLNGWQAVADQNYEAVFAGLSYGIQSWTIQWSYTIHRNLLLMFLHIPLYATGDLWHTFLYADDWGVWTGFCLLMTDRGGPTLRGSVLEYFLLDHSVIVHNL